MMMDGLPDIADPLSPRTILAVFDLATGQAVVIIEDMDRSGWS